MIDVFIFGASGQARSIAEIITVQMERDSLKMIGYISDIETDSRNNDDNLPILSFESWVAHNLDSKVVLGVGQPKSKRLLATRVTDAGGSFLHGVWDSSAGIRSHLEIGCGTYIGYGTYVGPGCRIGDHVSLLTNCSVGHDVTIGDFCTVCPTSTISGNVILEDGVFLGAGSIISNGTRDKPLVIGRDATVAAGALVTKSVAPGETVIGNPAMPLRAWAKGRVARG